MLKRGLIILAVWLGSTPVFASTPADVRADMNIIWVMFAAALVFFMQAGFSLLETGLVRAKNTINVAMKNFTDFAVAMVVFWLVGFGLMFGKSMGGIVGTNGFLMLGYDTPWDYTFFVFQVVFAGTAATIVSGAVAERMRFEGYLITTIVISCLIYPITGHWIWGGGLISDQAGWLGKLGFYDFAGSTVVHSVGGWVGLAVAWFLGPRIGRYDGKGKLQPIPGHNLQMASAAFSFCGWDGSDSTEEARWSQTAVWRW